MRAVRKVVTMGLDKTLFRAAFAHAAEAMMLADDTGQLVEVNAAACALFGLTADALLACRVPELPLADGDGEQAWLAFLKRGMARGDVRIQRKDGTLRVVAHNAIANVAPGYHLSVMRDVTAERAGEEARKRLEAIVASTNDAIVGTDGQMRVTSWNRAAEVIFGYSAAEMLGQPVAVLIPQDRRGEFGPLHARVLRGGEMAPFECQRQRKDGTLVDVALSAAPIRDAAGNLIGTAAILRDISEAKQLRTQLMTADRLATTGTLAAGIAHEINNPLTGVVAHLETAKWLLSELPSQRGLDELQTSIDDAALAANQVRQISRDLKVFSRPDAEHHQLVRVEDVLDSALRMMWNEVRYKACVIKHYGESRPVEANQTRLGQVFVNLLLNAAHAIAPGNLDTNHVTLVTRDAGASVVIEVTDTGCGMDAATLSQVFEPFFSTKGPEKGSGIGLTISRDIVRALGGELTAESAPGRGSTFRVTLPAAAATVPQIVGREWRRRVLIIDDEPMLARALAQLLGRTHDVTALSDPEAALQLLLDGTEFDCILTDQLMPRLSGLALYQRLEALRPHLARRVVFLSGDVTSDEALAIRDATGAPCLEKPVTAATLRLTVQAVLDGGAAA